MPRTFEVSVDSPATVVQILSAFSDEHYWAARLDEFTGGSAVLKSLHTEPCGTVNVTIALGLLRDRLPKVVSQFHAGDVEMVREETWGWIADGRVRGAIGLSVTGAPVSAVGRGLLATADNGSRMTYAGSVAVNVPLLGGRIETVIGRQTVEEIVRLQRFTNDWIAGHH